jgi:hypothetical protein
LPRSGLNACNYLVLNFYLKPFACSEGNVYAYSRMKRDIEFTNASNEVSDISKAFLFDCAIEEVVVLIESFFSLINDAFDRSLGIGEVFDRAEVYFEILFFPS